MPSPTDPLGGSAGADFDNEEPAPQTMTARIRVRELEAPWGSGLTSPFVTTVEIPAVCPTCGGPRGVPRNLNQVEDGAHYSVDVWDNPCGHVDAYEAVAREAGLVRA